jgi:imidazolonepropionase-like amidohydrolase
MTQLPDIERKGRVIYENALIIDGNGGVPFNGSIGVEDSKISFVEPVPRSSAAEWSGERIDLDGNVVVPGLIDCHVHLVSPWSAGMHEPYWKLAAPPSEKALTALANAAGSLSAGFTTLRNCGGTSWGVPEDVCVRNAVFSGMVIGPRVLAAAGGISMTGGHGDRAYPAYMTPHPEIGCGVSPADGPDSCRKAVRERIKYGADFIKIYTTGGVSTPGDGPHSQDFTMDELRAIIEEAHSHGKRVATHAQGLSGIRKAVLAGVDTVEHGSFLDRDTADEMALRGTVLVTTLRVFGEILKRGKNYPNQEALQKARMVRDAQERALLLAKNCGVTLAMGTDASQSIRNGNNSLEMESLAGIGFSTMEVMLMATRNAAIALGLQESLGTLSPGKQADFIVVRDNPLNDISILSDLKNIMCVVRGGIAYILRDNEGMEYRSMGFSGDSIRRVLAVSHA